MDTCCKAEYLWKQLSLDLLPGEMKWNLFRVTAWNRHAGSGSQRMAISLGALSPQVFWLGAEAFYWGLAHSGIIVPGQSGSLGVESEGKDGDQKPF